nr:hypothetical protein [Tanacetum cinerariifolium]
SDIEEESKKVVLGADEGCQSEGQAGPDPGAQAEGQMRSDAGAQDDGQAGSNLMKFLKARLDQTLVMLERIRRVYYNILSEGSRESQAYS